MNPNLKIRNIVFGEGRPKICVPLIGISREELLAEAEAVVSSAADLVEWRVDRFEAADADAVLSTLPALRATLGGLPLLFTFRTAREGGIKEMSSGEYINLNLAAIASGDIDLVDIELFSGDDQVRQVVGVAHQRGVAVIVSNHDFEKTPPRAELVWRLRKMRALGADIPKLAVMPVSFADVLTLLAATDDFTTGGADCPVITMSMGRLGGISRVSGEFSGACLTFGTVTRASAPGQMSVADLDRILNIFHRS